MRIENDFTVNALPSKVWSVLMDMPVVVSCMPGAELIETIDATHWKTKLAVKVGPISLVFAADLERETADVDSGRMVMTSKARESKGRGGATTRIESVMESVADGTRILIVMMLPSPALRHSLADPSCSRSLTNWSLSSRRPCGRR